MLVGYFKWMRNTVVQYFNQVRGNSDVEAVRMANNCDFALSSCAFSGSYRRAAKIASQLTAGTYVSIYGMIWHVLFVLDLYLSLPSSLLSFYSICQLKYLLCSILFAGMSAVNDLEGCTYMSQSLPFGGCKKSGYDRFAGPEGIPLNSVLLN